jgi:hypothetical protein
LHDASSMRRVLLFLQGSDSTAAPRHCDE